MYSGTALPIQKGQEGHPGSLPAILLYRNGHCALPQPDTHAAARTGLRLRRFILRVLYLDWTWCYECPRIAGQKTKYKGSGLVEIGRASCRERVCQYV